jgi:hypothetical protein
VVATVTRYLCLSHRSLGRTIAAAVLLAAFGIWTARNLTVTGTPSGPTYGQELSDGVTSTGRPGLVGLVARNVAIYTTDRFQEGLVPLRGPTTRRLLEGFDLGWAPTASTSC